MIYKTHHYSKDRSLCTLQTTDPSEERILCIHGWLDNHASFLPLITLAPKWPWMSIDLPGHGQSPWLSSENFYSFENYLCDLALVLESLSQYKIHLVGHSMGAALVSILAGLYPDKIQSVVLLDGLGPLVSTLDMTCEQFRMGIQAYLNPRKPRIHDSLEALAQARQKKHLISIEACRLLAVHGSYYQSKKWHWSFDPKLLGIAPFQMNQHTVLEILKEVRCPVLFIKPQSGYPYQEHILNERIGCLKTFSTISIAGGHHAHMDNPKKILDAISSFYRAHASTHTFSL